MTIFGTLGGFAAALPKASTNAASSSGVITAKRICGELVVRGVLGDRLRRQVGFHAEGDDLGLLPHRGGRLVRLGELLTTVAAPRGEQFDEHGRADAIGERERHSVDVDDVDRLPRREIRF